jgi:hypothetical protein
VQANIIIGALTVMVAAVGFFWLPATPETAWFLSADEKEAARLRSLRDGSKKVNIEFSLRECFQTWSDWKFPLWCIISFTYPVAFATCANFLPIVLQRLGYSTVVTNLLSVPPNCVGFLVLLVVAYSSDRFRERTYHIVFSLLLSMVGLIMLAALDMVNSRGVAYFACFLVAAGAYIPSCLVHSWHNNNNLNENSRAANTGFLVGLGNLGGILSAATFRTEYAPKYAPCLIATACCNAVCIVFTLWLGVWMKRHNVLLNREQGIMLKPEDVDTSELEGGEKDPRWRYFT